MARLQIYVDDIMVECKELGIDMGMSDIIVGRRVRPMTDLEYYETMQNGQYTNKQDERKHPMKKIFSEFIRSVAVAIKA